MKEQVEDLRCSHLSSLSQRIGSDSLYLCDVQGKGHPPKEDYYTSTGTISCNCLCQTIKRELRMTVERTFFWTDSTSVLKYVANSHTDCSSPSQWRHVPSKLNPAGDASRGLKIDELLTNSRWKMGLPFQWQTQDKWTSYPGVEQLSQGDPKVKKDAKVGGVLTEGDAIQVDQLLDRFSSWHSLKMFVA